MAKIAVLLLVALFGLAVADSSFDAYVKKYNKNYSAGEYASRMQIYQANVRSIAMRRAASIARGEQPWMGVNQFTDMTHEEFMKSGRVMQKKLDGKDAISCLAKGVEVDASKLSFDIPTNFDWRDKNVVQPIQDQQQCGSCWAFSTVSAIESAHAIKSGTLDKLSEQEIVDCSHACVLEMGQQVCNQGCDGGWPWSAYTDIMSWKGLATEKSYPYTANTDKCKRSGVTPIDQISNYTCLSGPKYANETVMAAFLVANGPLSIAMDAGLLETYTSGIIKPTKDECSTTQLDHAINIVGYGTESGTDYWIVRNSWGLSWGEKGYFRIIRGKGACGLNAGVSFPLAA